MFRDESWSEYCAADGLDFNNADELLCPTSGRFPLLLRVVLAVSFFSSASTMLLQGMERRAYHPPIFPRVQAAGLFRFLLETDRYRLHSE